MLMNDDISDYEDIVYGTLQYANSLCVDNFNVILYNNGNGYTFKEKDSTGQVVNELPLDDNHEYAIRVFYKAVELHGGEKSTDLYNRSSQVQ